MGILVEMEGSGFQFQTTLIVIRLLQRPVKSGYTPTLNGVLWYVSIDKFSCAS